MKNVILFASGSGSNAEAIMQHLAGNPGIRVAAVFCNNPAAGVISRAARFGIPVVLFKKAELRDTDHVDRKLEEYSTDLIVLAGFLQLFPERLILRYPNRIINLHPSLLPAYGGKGMYGHHVHEAVLAAGEKQSGITVHFVNEHFDKGEIIRQVAVPVMPDDTPDSLAARINQAELATLPKLVEELALSLG